MGDTGASQDMPYKGMLAMDEYGTRRIKYWLKHCIDPGLRQLGEVIKEYSQAVYKAHKVFRIVQPDEVKRDKQVEINVPIYNDFGEAINKWRDYETAKFDVKIVAGSTLPINRWAYLEELKQLMGLGVVDDIAVLAETDIKNKESIVQRKSLYSQLQGQIGEQDEKIKDLSGTIETLERQLVQAGIKQKVMAAEVEIRKKANETKSGMYKQELETIAQQKHLRKERDRMSKDEKEKMKNANKALDK
tara:strand:- start:264 stop:1001 length:738 start_codon:yes stop_codon:yes gene_type:complete